MYILFGFAFAQNRQQEVSSVGKNLGKQIQKEIQWQYYPSRMNREQIEEFFSKIGEDSSVEELFVATVILPELIVKVNENRDIIWSTLDQNETGFKERERLWRETEEQEESICN